MIWNRFIFVGVQLLLLVYTAQSFVLLTANIEDLKNLARKFVSESVADQLVEFVVKATGQMSEQMGESSGKNRIKSDDISASNEYELRNIARQGEEKKKQARYVKRDEQEYITRTTRNEEKQRPNYLSNESKELSMERDERLLEDEKTWQKSSKEMSIERINKQDKTKARNWRDRLGKRKESEHPISTKPKNVWPIEKNKVTNNDLFSQERPKHSFISQYGNQDDKRKEHYRPSKQSGSFLKESENDFNEPQQYTKSTSFQTYFPNYKPQKSQKSDSKTLDERMSESAEKPSSGSRYKKINDRDSKTLTFDFKLPKSQQTEKKHDTRESSVERYFGSRYKKINDRNFKMPAHSNESNSKSDGDKLWDLETTRFRGLPLDQGDGIMTNKEKTDFDPYEHRNYPKAELIATSGQLMLPRMSSNYYKKPKPDEKSWWEKNLKLPDAAKLKSWLATV